MNKKILFGLLFAILFFSRSTYAQSWRWGERGGSSDGSTNGPDETVVDMTTDPTGNIYVLSNVYHTSLSVAGHSLSAYGSEDILLTSFSCDGTYRWSKLLGGSSQDIPASVKTDNMGGVYVTGYFSTHYITLHLDSDTSWAAGSSYKNLFIVKYDTSGIYKWFRMPQSDTAGPSTPSNVRALDMDVDSAGNIYTMFGLTAGAYANGSYIAPSKGIYVLKYNSSGIFQGGTQLQIGYTALATGGLLMKRDFSLNRYYITGAGVGLSALVSNLTFNGSPVTHPLFIGAFDDSGNFLWDKENTSGFADNFGRVAIDGQHNIYLAGVSSNGDTFNSYTVVNTVTSVQSGLPLVVKMDANGNNVWAKNASINTTSYGFNIALNDNKVTLAGAYAGTLKWPGWSDSLHHIMNQGYDIFVTQFDASNGNVSALDTIASSFGYAEYASAITSDKHGNVYVGGNFNGDLYVNGSTLASTGGGSDFFVAKYGYDNCGCTATPAANFTVNTTNAPTVNFAYTGTTTGLDSVSWDFGDGATGSGSNTAHTYSAAGMYYVCATAHTSCGSDTHCDSVNVPVSVANLRAFPDVQIYPNPVNEALFVSHIPAGTQITLSTLMGQQVYRQTTTGTDRTVINTSQLPAGTYLLQLSDSKGNRAATTVVKQ